MPHTTVDYSESLTETFDRRGFALALHPLVATVISTQTAGCRTYFRRIEEAVIADGGPEQAVIRIEVAILSGRAPEVKAELSEAVLELARKHTAAAPGLIVQTSVEITDLDRTSYRNHTEGLV